MEDNVVGPLDRDTWVTLKRLRRSIINMKKKNDLLLQFSIDKETEIYEDILKGEFKTGTGG